MVQDESRQIAEYWDRIAPKFDSPQTGIEDLRFNGEDDTRLEWRVEFRRDHRNFVQFQTDAVCDEPDLIFTGAHEMRGE